MHVLLHSVPTSLPQATACTSTRDSWASLGQSLLGSLLLSPGPSCTQGSVCAVQESNSPVLYKFWWLWTSSMKAYAIPKSSHTQACCTHSPCLCGSSLLTHASSNTEDTQTQFCLSLCGSLGPGAHKFCLSPLSVTGSYGI